MIEPRRESLGQAASVDSRAGNDEGVEVQANDVELSRLQRELTAEQGRLSSMRGSWSWRLTLPFRVIARAWRRMFAQSPPAPAPFAVAPPPAPPPALEETIIMLEQPRVAVENASPAPIEPPFPARFALDLPSVREFAPGQIRFYGWCLGPEDSPPSDFRVRVGQEFFPSRINIPRPDVLAVLGVPEKSLGCGFDVFLKLARGASQITLEAQFDGVDAWRTIDTFEVLAADELEGYDGREWRAYRNWLKQHDTFDGAARERLAARCASIESPTIISVLMPTWNTPEPVLRAAIESVRNQVYPYWQLCIADDASQAPHVRAVLAEYSRLDARIVHCIRSEQGNISLATNTALELATGKWVAFLDHDDELHPAALACVALEIAAHPDVELIYTDEDKVDVDGRRSSPHFKPDWDPELLVGQNYVCHLVALPRQRLREVGGLRPGFEGCQDWDLVLRATEASPGAKVRHVPRVLYHWRIMVGSTALGPDEKDYVSKRAERALREHFARTGEAIEDILPVAAGLWRIVRAVPKPAPLVSILIPTRDRIDLLERCVESVRAVTRYPHFEILIVDNQSTDPATLAKLREWQEAGHARVIPFQAPFNYSALHNVCVPQCTGELICLLNNDTEAFEPDWLAHMVAQATREGVGAVGAMLLYPDDTIQHAGTILGLGGIGDHRHAREPRYCEGHMGRLRVAHQLSAVTAACMVFRKSIYLQAGGMDERNLEVTYNDVDFCLRLLELGYRNIWTPLAVLYHHESASRGFGDTVEKRAQFRGELEFMRDRWGDRLQRDPAYNPNCTLHHKDGGLAAIPRLDPW